MPLSTRVHRGPLRVGLLGAVALISAPAAASAGTATSGSSDLRVLRASLLPVGHPRAGDVVTLKLSATQRITSFTLNYGDHTKEGKGAALPPKARHLYGRPGKYDITLEVADARHRHLRVVHSVLILPAPRPAATVTVAAPAPAPVPAPPPLPPPPPGHLVVTSPDNAVLGLGGPARLLFSTATTLPPSPPRVLTFTDTGPGPLTVSSPATGGADAGDFVLDPATPASFTLGPGESRTVAVAFRPAAPTGCTSPSQPLAVADSVRSAQLTFVTSGADGAAADVDQWADLSGLAACGTGGYNEPVLDQIVAALGYTTVVDDGVDRRNLGGAPLIGGTDEVVAPSFVPTDPATPVSLVPLARYAGTSTAEYGATGWYAAGSAVTTPCSDVCRKLYDFPSDGSTGTGDTEQQKLLPQPIGGTTFQPAGPFGLYEGDNSDVAFSDDALNPALTGSHQVASPLTFLHDIRVYPAYGPGRVAIPHTWLVAMDVGRIPADKNDDFQDVVCLLRGADPVG